MYTRRTSPRAEGFDYANSGVYYVTVRTHEGRFLLGDIEDGVMKLSPFGRVVERLWNALPTHFTCVTLDAFVVMPNHLHGVLYLEDGLNPITPHSLSAVIGALKSFSSREINQMRETPGGDVWQRSFYDHIVRNGADLERVRTYIHANPGNWPWDRHNPDRIVRPSS